MKINRNKCYIALVGNNELKLVKGSIEHDYLRYQAKNFALITTKPVFFKKRPLFFVKQSDLNTFCAEQQIEIDDEHLQRFERFLVNNKQFIRHTYQVDKNINEYKHLLTEDVIFSFVSTNLMRQLMESTKTVVTGYLTGIAIGFSSFLILMIILAVFSPNTLSFRLGGA